MSAIYQRARPIRWEDVVGQEHVKEVLRSALEQGRVGHAYLFSGPRGVGKTTTARLIAMTANCTSGGVKPCGECESCLSVRAGNHPDVLEIDAASNNSVDDVRDLREKVGLAAMRGGKKIYILDEAHMMSRAAFNALLKTLEEPPSHVIFILATTEPEKIIPTILSRCQHYRFRRHTPEEIAGKLAGLATQEGVKADPDALNLIGRLADGAMRDGESLLERMLAAGSAITRVSVEEALGLPPSERVRGIAEALVMGDAGAAISGAASLYRDGFAARTVVEGLVAAYGAALHAELGLSQEGRLEGADVPRLLKLQAALDEQESRFARSADQQSLELALTHAILAVEGGSGGSAASSPSSANVPADLVQRLNRLEKELSTLRASGVRPAAASGVADFDPTARDSGTRRGPTPMREAVAQASETFAAPTQGSWADVIRQASMQLKAFLKPAKTHAEAGYVSLTYEAKNAFHAKQVAAKFDDLSKLVLAVFGPVTFELVAPDNIGKKQKLGGAAQSTQDLPPEPPKSERVTPAPTPITSAEPVADFDPKPRRSPVPNNAAPNNAVSAQNLAVDAAPVPIATTPPPPRQPNIRSRSPDDVAPAPLPDDPFEPWEEEHVADPPPAPADAGGGDLITPPGASRELYIVEAITEEPDWGEIGGAIESAGPPLLEDAPFAEYSAGIPTTNRATAPAKATSPAKAEAPAAPSKPGDIRAHPMYDEVKARFSGRVREIGKNRNYQPPAATEEASEEEATDAAEA